jgi:uncharacterized protein YcfJ
MKRITALVLLSFIAFSSPVLADGYEFAQVTLVIPHDKLVSVPSRQQDCWRETVAVDSDFSPVGAAGGAIVGGLLGRAIDRGFDSGGRRYYRRGSGNDWTVVGAVTGGLVGGMGGRRTQVVLRCEPSSGPAVIHGFDVTYEYHGQRRTEWMQRNPGDRIRVYVETQTTVTPVQQGW